MLAAEIAPGLWRWTAPHPEWVETTEGGSAGEWDELVGSVLYELEDRVALIDPLLPVARREQFLNWLDERIGGRPVGILTTVRWHRRDRELLAERYRTITPGAWNAVPAGVKPVPLRGAGETVYWLERVDSLVVGDCLLGAPEGGLRLCPESWLNDVAVDRAGLAHLLGRLLELPIECVLVSHGDPVLHDGRAALARAIAQARR